LESINVWIVIPILHVGCRQLNRTIRKNKLGEPPTPRLFERRA
jgi:hypothetical protein